ncbi:Uncharacterized protein T07A5.1 [Toxocara canis]|uniref:Uncharacterized protein T07A5.1 n=1 Tax=Toxocara canis TaxID=6265 RepID=A0A0B2V3W2_TOXCA|nr:Uncharacterized protein T07A5.1 [Toxocara canis]
MKKALACFALPLLCVFGALFCMFSLRHVQQPSSVHISVKHGSVFTHAELIFLRSLGHLFLLDAVPHQRNEIWFASLDVRMMMAQGRVRVFPMEKSPSTDYVKFYVGGEVHAIHGLRAASIMYDGVETSIPLNVDSFLWKWQSSRFIDCRGLKLSDVAIVPVIKKSFVRSMARFRNFIERYRSRPLLFGGTLLGWYRECAFISDTTDVDFAMHINELNEVMLQDLQILHSPKLYWILGMVNDSLELSVYADSVKIDLFFVFRDKHEDWVGGMDVGAKQKLRWSYPRIDKHCVGDLYGRLFNVPCNVEQVLQADYGRNWTTHHKNSEFFWRTSHKNVRKGRKWKNNEWRSAYRLF